MQRLRSRYLHCILFVVAVFLSVEKGNPCKRLFTIRSRANQMAQLLMDQNETNPRKEAVPLLIKRRGRKKRAKKLQERRSSRKQEKGKRKLVNERQGRSNSNEKLRKEIFFEGDLKLNDHQKESLMARKQGCRVSGTVGRTGRAALKNVDELWPEGLVKYQLASGIYTESKEVVRNTLKELQSKLGDCIRFQETDRGNRIFVNWSRHRSWSWYGYQGNVQNLDLKNGHFTPGIIQHEFLHAIGLLHTQARMDRDNFVQIFWENIHPDDKQNFEKHDSNHFGLPYDFHSLMHYGEYACNICGYRNGVRIKTHDPNMQSVREESERKLLSCHYFQVIGQRNGVSPGDIQLVRKLYNCDQASLFATATHPATPLATPRPTTTPALPHHSLPFSFLNQGPWAWWLRG